MITNLVALLIVTNAVMEPCPYCNPPVPEGYNLPPGLGLVYPVVHEHEYKYVVTTNYLPVVVDPREGGAP